MPDSAESSAAVFEHDHREIDEKFSQFAASVRQGRTDPVPLAAAATDLRHHIYVEEVYHFPLARAAGLFGPVLVMLREHGQIWDLLDELESQVRDGAGAGAESLLGTWARLERVLDHHNLKEESILYPAGDQSFTPEQTAELIGALRSASRPADWRCAYAGRT